MILPPLTLLFLLVPLISGSDGDERESFQLCVQDCSANHKDSVIKCELNSILKLTGWDCGSDCRYRCMRHDIKSTAKVVQYYGKWPFKRVLGAQEIFSVIFSLGNLVACLYGYFWIYKSAGKKQEDKEKKNKEDTIRVKASASVKTSTRSKSTSKDHLRLLHQIGLLITCNTWLQSAIFHYRDTPLTEKLDYFSACLCILYTFPLALITVFDIRNRSNQLKVILPVLLAYLQHIYYMAFVSFDYGYNIKFNALFGVLSNVLWLYFALKTKNSEALRFVVANVLSMAMVAIDFPPFFELIDMHALWHLSTIPITLMWYNFIK